MDNKNKIKENKKVEPKVEPKIKVEPNVEPKIKVEPNVEQISRLPLLTTVDEILGSYNGNNNTGVNYEISVCLALLQGSKIINNNCIPEKYKRIGKFKSPKPLKGIKNLSQLDNIGGTADILLVYEDNTSESFNIASTKSRITESSKNIDKCISNPTAKSYGINKTDESEERNEKAFAMAEEYRIKNYGSKPNPKWKRSFKCPGAKYMCTYMAKNASDSFNNFDESTKTKIVSKFLDLENKNGKLKPSSDGIIYYNIKKNKIEKFYYWELSNINLSNYISTCSDGIYIYHGTPSNYIIRTQAKYNNGIIEGMKSGTDPINWKPIKSKAYLSSWNCVANIRKIFKLTEIKSEE